MNSIKYLKLVLKGNAVFSGLCAIVLILLHNPISNLYNIPNPIILIGLGVGLIVFALLVLNSAKKANLNPTAVKTIIVLDFLWVLGSLIIIGFQLFALQYMAYVLMGLIALAVGDFGAMQALFLYKSQKAAQ